VSAFSTRGASDEGHLAIGRARLYHRTVGEGTPVVVLHGGPDFDHTYLLPELDLLADSLRLVYYDQRGRGRSARAVQPDDVDIDSEIADLDGVRRHFGFDSVALLGHSWGCVLALEYATRHPERMSHLILLNSAPASGEDVRAFREELRGARPPGDVERMQELAASARYESGDLDADLDYYRVHFSGALRQPEQLEQVVGRLRTHFSEKGVLVAREIEDRLYARTWDVDGYDLVPRLGALDIPALVLHGAHDFVPVALAARIANALPQGRLIVLEECGHFSYLEAPEAVHEHVTALFRGGASTRQRGTNAAHSIPK
jgi:proline iminopeptidase